MRTPGRPTRRISGPAAGCETITSGRPAELSAKSHAGSLRQIELWRAFNMLSHLSDRWLRAARKRSP